MPILDGLTGLRHGDLNYSYVVLGHQSLVAAQKNPTGWGRAVSDPMDLGSKDPGRRQNLVRFLRSQVPEIALAPLEDLAKQGRLKKSLVCHKSGALVGLYGDGQQVRQSAPTKQMKNQTHAPGRGDAIEKEPEKMWVIPERRNKNTAQSALATRGARKPRLETSPARPARSRSNKARR